MLAEFTRVDTLELKDLIYRKIGHQRADSYFDQLNKFLTLNLSKAEFDRSCVRTIGRENVSLHNKLIRSILQNATQTRIPPRKARKVEGLDVRVDNGYQRSYLQTLYGDAFPQSPRKCRSPMSRDRKFRDRPSPLGPLGKSPSLTYEETATKTQEQQSATATELHSVCSRPNSDVGEEVESLTLKRWSRVDAPLGVGCGTRTGFHRGYKDYTFGESCESRSELLDTVSLRRRLEKKLASEGVGISLECANVVNNGLDVFLKSLLEPSLSLASNEAVIDELKGKLPARFDERSTGANLSMLDFRVAVESNPRLLGPDWPVQLEKISHYASEE